MVEDKKDEVVDNVKVKKTQVFKAVKTLQQVVAKRAADSDQQQLFDSQSETMTVLFTLTYMSQKRSNKARLIPLPHPLYDKNSEVCFISKDPQKHYKDLLINQHPVPGLTKVIGIDKLKRNYKGHAEKVALADSFDLFLCDTSIVEMMPHILGSIFYKKRNKHPLPVVLKKNDPKASIEKALGGTTMRIPTGTTVGVRFGRCNMELEKLVENANTVIATVKKFFAGTNPIQAIHIQCTDTPALPVYRRPAVGTGISLKEWKQWKADNSSAASDTEGGSVIGSEDGTTIESMGTLSDAGETLSTRDSISDIGSSLAGDSLSELSEQDSDADETPSKKKGKKAIAKASSMKKSPRQSPKQSPTQSPEKSPVQSPKVSPMKSPKQSPKQSPKRAMLPPPVPAKKAKKSKA